MNKSFFEKEYEVNSINININKRLGLYGMLGILQDVGAIHAEYMGVGMEAMIENNAFWVFTQQKLKMQRWPKWQDHVVVKTWPRKIHGLKAYRDYTIHVGDELIGESVATFMVLDGKTRKPTQPKLSEEIINGIPDKELEIIPEKVMVPSGLEYANTIMVRNSDLDMNNHVNNTKYAQWILDTIKLDYHRRFVVSEFDMNFISECRLGDEIEISLLIDEKGDTVTSYYQGVRKSDKKVVFNAHISGVAV